MPQLEAEKQKKAKVMPQLKAKNPKAYSKRLAIRLG
jgi:hypothetical protein